MSDKLLAHPAALLNRLRLIALDAGAATLRHFDECGYEGAETKGDGSPVTQADRDAERIIETALAELLPDIPMIGEEAVDVGKKPDLSGHEFFWLVDPLDGTREFISGSGEYTVNIALIRGGEPWLGVVFAPVSGELYAGGPGGAVRWLEETGHEKPIHTRKAPKEGLTVVASRRHGSGERLERFLENYKINKLVKRGSSLKICAIAAGRADIYPRMGPTCEWDTAAGHAVLRAAGGEIVDFSGRPLRYGGADGRFLNPEFCALSGDITIAA